MALQKYRADFSELQSDGSVKWYANWIGGKTLSKISNCQVSDSYRRLTVYVTGEAITWFALPACTSVRGKYVSGYLTNDIDGFTVFHANDKFKDRLV